MTAASPALSAAVEQALEDNKAALLQAAKEIVAAAYAEATKAAADLAAHIPATRRLADILGDHRTIAGRCRCGFDPRLDWHRQETHVAEQIIAAAQPAPPAAAE